RLDAHVGDHLRGRRRRDARGGRPLRSGGAMTADPSQALHAHLSARLPTMRDQYIDMLRDHVPFYRAMTAERLVAPVETLLRTFLDESLPTWDLVPTIALASRTLRLRAVTGLDRDGALSVSTCFRRVFLHSVESLLEHNIPGVARLLLFVDDFCETIEV